MARAKLRADEQEHHLRRRLEARWPKTSKPFDLKATVNDPAEQGGNDHAPVIITRKTQPSVVMMSLEDYQAMQETTYLLRSPENARRLLSSIAELEDGKGSARELIE